MADVGELHFVKSRGSSDRVLVPQPSSDPHDPLVSLSKNILNVLLLTRNLCGQNWKKTWKFSTMFIATMVTFSQSMGPLAIAPQFPALMQSFDRSLEDVIAFSGVCILVLGFSNFFW